MRQELFMDGDARVNSQIWYIMSYVLKKCLYDYRSWAAPHSPLSYIIWHWCFAPYHGRNHCNEWPFDVFPISHIAETSIWLLHTREWVWPAYWTIITWCTIPRTVLYWLLMEQSTYIMALWIEVQLYCLCRFHLDLYHGLWCLRFFHWELVDVL